MRQCLYFEPVFVVLHRGCLHVKRLFLRFHTLPKPFIFEIRCGSETAPTRSGWTSDISVSIYIRFPKNLLICLRRYVVRLASGTAFVLSNTVDLLVPADLHSIQTPLRTSTACSDRLPIYDMTKTGFVWDDGKIRSATQLDLSIDASN